MLGTFGSSRLTEVAKSAPRCCYNGPVNERFVVAGLSLVALLGLWLAPWAALSRSTGARNSVLLLPNRYLDFSGRTDFIPVAGLGTVLMISIVALLVVLGAALLRNNRWRAWLWLGGGLLLVATTFLGPLKRAFGGA